MAGGNGEADIVQYGPVRLIGKADAFETDVAPRHLQRRRLGQVLHLHRRLQQTEQALDVDQRLADLPVDEAEEVERRSEEHTSELQSRPHLVCRLLLEKKKKKKKK